MLKTLLAAIAVLLSLGLAAEAHERAQARHPYRFQHAPRSIVVVPQDPIQGVGCYWARQTQFCARYCYWQPDGRRYCVERERQARREHVPVVPVYPYVDWPLK
ncbi:MAG: hypothetical protein ACKVP7_05580 [Hyphomicrobiaceae bacterium]